MTTTLALTGVTGRLGSLIAGQLATAGLPARHLARSPERAAHYEGAQVVQATYFDTPATRQALAGITTLLMVSASESADRVEQHRQFVQAAVAAGVQHIVYISFFNPAPDATFTFARDHFATEQFIREAGVNFTFLRDNFYQEVFPLFVQEGQLAGPAADGRVSAVALADVALVAAQVLAHPENYRNRVLNLTGPQALSMAEMAELMTEARGEQITYRPETLEEAYASRASYGAPSWEVDGWVSTYTAIADGSLEDVSGDVQTVLGRPAQFFAQTLQKMQQGAGVKEI